MPYSTRHMALLRPAAVAVHDDGDVVGDGSHSFCVEMSSLTSGGMGASGLSLPYTEKASQIMVLPAAYWENWGFRIFVAMLSIQIAVTDNVGRYLRAYYEGLLETFA